MPGKRPSQRLCAGSAARATEAASPAPAQRMTAYVVGAAPTTVSAASPAPLKTCSLSTQVNALSAIQKLPAPTARCDEGGRRQPAVGMARA
eukprot:13097844-Alexandrium_andersonii.AAC.1